MIADELQCSKGTVAYHCNNTTKKKNKERISKERESQL